jgi:hypothetical protein
MFCIREDEIKVAPRDTADSHLEWFQKEGWINEENAEEFLNQHIRGFYLPSENSLYSYKGVSFWFDGSVLMEIQSRLPELKKALGLRDDTKIFFGSKDRLLDDIYYPKFYIGTLEEIVNQ